MLKKIISSLRLMRAGNCLVAGATCLAGAWTSQAEFQRDKPWLLALAVVLLTAFGNAYNDIRDLPIDRLNRPDRPLVSGAVSQILALRIAGWCLALGLMVAAYAYVKALVIALFVSFGLFLYGRALKMQPLVGNLVVALFCALAVVYGSLPGDWNRQTLILTVCAFSLTLVREIYKDIQDVPGDAAMGGRTLPIVWGVFPASLFALAPLLFTAGFVTYRLGSSVPDWKPAYGMGVTLILGLLWTGLRSLSTKSVAHWGRRSREIKIWIILGVLWVIAWRLPIG